jgi:hypothetical protein
MIGKLAQSVQSNVVGKVVDGVKAQPMRVFAFVLSANVMEAVLDSEQRRLEKRTSKEQFKRARYRNILAHCQSGRG